MNSRQQDLFDLSPEPWELDDDADRPIATVVFPEGVGGEFDYVVPDKLRDQLEVGQRLHVPLGRGNRQVIGYCVHLETGRKDRRLKEVAAVLDPQSLITPQMLRLTQWMAAEYLCSWGKVLDTVVPAAVRAQAGTRLTTFVSVVSHRNSRLAGNDLPAKQSAVLKLLRDAAEPMRMQHVLSLAECTGSVIRALADKGFVRLEKRRVARVSMDEIPPERHDEIELNADQRRAVETTTRAVHASRHETLLLHGVTGSGKTEVYIRAIQEVIGFGRQAIVLVPEISLTPQTVRRFQSRFANVAVLHSHLAHPERNWHWRRIASGQVQVVVGAQSAVFAPTPNLGLIVLDEEHDGSFKQDAIPRYHARDVARRRAELERIPLILGSATPSLESFHGAKQGRVALIPMPRRVLDLPLPQVSTIDLRLEFQHRYHRGAISRPLRRAMAETLDDGGQVILLLNRRGYSTHIQCPACGAVVRCQHCDIALTHHRDQEIVLCHYCEYQRAAPPRCPECGFEGIRYGGLGTQRLEAEVRGLFPRVECLRMDSDTMRKPGSRQAALAKFRHGEVQVLLGTQMIAKGLDFPNVTLVGVINADTGLHLPDFRAAERTFQLVTQVAGRTGRGSRGGHVLVQTFSPEHYAVETACQHDYAKFAQIELENRRTLNYPPWGEMLRLIFRGPSDQRTRAFADEVAAAMQAFWSQANQRVRVLGPAPAPIAKLRGHFRFHTLLQAGEKAALQAAVRHIQQTVRPPEDVQWLADVDPLEML